MYMSGSPSRSGENRTEMDSIRIRNKGPRISLTMCNFGLEFYPGQMRFLMGYWILFHEEIMDNR